jgi:hypothetical protein
MRYKTKVESLGNSLDKLLGLSCFKFYYSEDVSQKTRVGLSAQEVKEVLPEVVTGSEEGRYQILYSELVPVLVASIQEQQQIIVSQRETLTTQVAAIEQIKSRIVSQGETLTALAAALDALENKEVV